jgi:hypothetical protein
MKAYGMVVFAVILLASSLGAAPSKALLMQRKAEGLTKSVLKSKSSSRPFYRAEDELALPQNAKAAAGAGAAGRRAGYRVLSMAPAAVEETLSERGAAAYRRVYYTSAIKSPRNRFIATGNMLVQLAPGITAEAFAAAQWLTLLGSVNAPERIFMFSPLSRQDLIGQCNRLNTLEEVTFATPEWIKPVRLR